MKPFKCYRQLISEGMISGKTLILKSRCQGKRMSHYFLNEDKTYRPCAVLEWAKQFETMDRRVAEDFVNDIRISTVWMGYNIHYINPPLVFETMIFKNGKEIYCTRCSTWDEAKQQHKIALKWTNGGCIEENE